MDTKKQYKNIIEENVKKELKDIEKKIHIYIEKSVLSLIGLEQEYYGRYEIDHCNGRNSVLIDVFRRIAIGEAEKIAKNYKPTKEDLLNYDKSFKDEMKSKMKTALANLAETKAQELTKEMFDKIKIDIDKLLEEEKIKTDKEIQF